MVCDATCGTEVMTYFAPAERANNVEISKDSEFVRTNPLFKLIQDSFDGYVLVLNQQRQVLAANPQMLRDLGVESVEDSIGRRLGEVIGCVHASDAPGGCGTSRACSTCGATASILASQNQDDPVVGECLMTIRRGEAAESLEFRVRVTPVHVDGRHFTVIVLHDISGDKRREALEHVFFHDILNTIGGLLGWSSLLQQREGMDLKMAAARIVDLSNRLTREVRDQRSLSQAEQGTLEISVGEASVREMLELLRSIFSAHEAAKGKNVEIQEINEGEKIISDSSLLVRVLTNMIKNALEAIDPGETVRVRFERRDEKPVFLVHNPGLIPPEVALRIFQRSYSTKSKSGRGIGTYSMKLFGEKFLKGKVEFETSAESGTQFSITLPSDGPPGAKVFPESARG